MKNALLATLIASSASLVTAQLGSALGLPTCAQNCIPALPSSCGTVDIGCICTNQDFINSIVCCASAACGAQDYSTALAKANALCTSNGAPAFSTGLTCNHAEASSAALTNMPSSSASASGSSAMSSMSGSGSMSMSGSSMAAAGAGTTSASGSSMMTTTMASSSSSASGQGGGLVNTDAGPAVADGGSSSSSVVSVGPTHSFNAAGPAQTFGNVLALGALVAAVL